MNIQIKNIPPATSALLTLLSKERYMTRFSLVGGTALALQLGHRQSEDLDFIFDAEKIDAIGIKRFIARTFPDHRLIREERAYQLDFLVNNVKLTFFSTGAVIIPFKIKPHTIQLGTVNIAKADVIAVLKMATISQRCTIRDYYDIYYISRYVISLDEIFRLTKSMIP
ncbi:MAG TPA: nucleotidyl transferase AbiEii/AbiGii toxin family protein, partial [Bacteroidales bacterium]|nr:nucleotidyl transferase AbiEii/AbiGii toxin family protein [Bacteroidales bacterium]